MSESPRSCSAEPSPTVLDLAELRHRAGGDEELVLELLGDFMMRESDVTLVAEAARSGDYLETSKLAHRTRSSLLALGAKAAARAAADVELQSTTLRDGTPDAMSIAQLERSIATLAVRFHEACAAMRDVQTGASAVTASCHPAAADQRHPHDELDEVPGKRARLALCRR